MSDQEKAPIHVEAPDPSEEAAASKLWAVYISEAEKYDRALVESWKNDMEGMLIFVCLSFAHYPLFTMSNALAATKRSFLILGKRQLLNQISQQLAAAANGTTFQYPAPAHITPPATSLVCNALWFISLGLSLTCALIATLLEQWARDFLHRADMRSAPVLRARIFSYLYYGLKRFSMHTVVDVVPLLLHASLLFFFGGLIAFLIPVNAAMSIIAATLLATVVGIYAVLTLLPLWHTDCPYHTPLSTAFWRLSRSFMNFWRRRSYTEPLGPNLSGFPPKETMMEAISRQATEFSLPRAARDYRALAWTVKSLADDSELEPFVQSLPDVLWGPLQRRYAYEDHVQKLMRSPELDLQCRIIGLLRSCHNGLLLPEASQRRQISCYKALWSIASLSQGAASSGHFEPLDFSAFIRSEFDLAPESNAVLHHSISAVALMQLSTFLWVKNRLTTLVRQLELDVTPNIQPITAYLNSITSKWVRYLPQWDLQELHLWDDLHNFGPPWSQSSQAAGLIEAVAHFSTETPYVIFFHYLMRASTLDILPYRWNETQQTFVLDDSPSAPFAQYQPYLEGALAYVAARDINAAGSAEQSDTIVRRLCHFWRPAHPCIIPESVVLYLNNRHCEVALRDLATSSLFQHMWPSILETVRNPVAIWTVAWDDVATAIWRMLSLQGGQAEPLSCSRLAWVEFAGLASPSPIIFSIIAMMKSIALDSLRYPCRSVDTLIPPLRHPLLPAETIIHFPPVFLDLHMGSELEFALQKILRARVVEAKIVVAAEFLHGFRSDFLPHKATETLDCILSTLVPRLSDIHDTHQLHFALGMRNVLNCNNPHGADILDLINNSNIFNGYFSAGQPQGEPEPQVVPLISPGRSHSDIQNARPRRPTAIAWLGNSTARAQIQEILNTHMRRISPPSPLYPPSNVLRVQGILDGIKLIHGDSGDI
ncbi:hypothetical protein DFH06DRAFT_1318780 [Mycena polygramma]|nr:hypothetical protein DFH06DRAFT_1318780 [Mycena polygramma]